MNRRERLEILGDKMKKFNNVYIKNFSDEMGEEELKDLFDPYGKLLSVKVWDISTLHFIVKVCSQTWRNHFSSCQTFVQQPNKICQTKKSNLNLPGFGCHL